MKEVMKDRTKMIAKSGFSILNDGNFIGKICCCKF